MTNRVRYPELSSAIVTPRDPTAEDDDTLYFNEGSLWVNSVTKDAFVCTDPTTSAAQWKKIGSTAHWQTAVINFLDFTTSEPASPSLGDRYINTQTGTSSQTAQSVTANYIYEWNGTNWTESIPEEGWQLWVNALDKPYIYTGTSWAANSTNLEEDHVYYVNDNGDDANSGKSPNEAFATITEAITEVNAQTPSSTNQFEIRVLGALIITSDFSIPDYTTICAFSAQMECEIKFGNESFLIAKNGISSFGKILCEKNSGSSVAGCIFTGKLDVANGQGFINTSSGGVFSIENSEARGTAGLLIGQGCVSEINFSSNGKITFTGAGRITSHNSTGLQNFYINDGYAEDGTTFSVTNGGHVNVIYNRLRNLNLRVFSIQSSYCNSRGNEWYESLKSVELSSLNQYDVLRYIRSGDADDDARVIRETVGNFVINVTNGKELIFRSEDKNSYYYKGGYGGYKEWPFFSAYVSGTVGQNVTGDGTYVTIPANSTDRILNSCYNTTSYLFTAQVDGIYEFGYNCLLTGFVSANTVLVYRIYINSSTARNITIFNPWSIVDDIPEVPIVKGVPSSDEANGTQLELTRTSNPIVLNNTDTVEIQVAVFNNATKNITIAANSYVHGKLLSRI